MEVGTNSQIVEVTRRLLASEESNPRSTIEPSAAFAPVFLHSSFRTGSTWLWSKLRSAPTTIAYYEVFHEALATMTLQLAKEAEYSTWDSRHPPSAPYFLEYLPFVKAEGGIAGFDQSFPWHHFIPLAGANSDLEVMDRAYVAQLILAAQEKMSVPIVSCTRSLGRSRALRRSFGGKTIFLHRNLFHQWASYCGQAENGNGYFFDTIRSTLENSAHDPFLQMITGWFGPIDVGIPQETLFQIFMLLHLYLYSIAFDAADIMVDLAEIADDASLRRRVEHDLSALIDHPIDLSEAAAMPCEYVDFAVRDARKMRDSIEQFAKQIPTAPMSSDAIWFVRNAMDKALQELERFEFYSRRTRVVLSGRLEIVTARIGDQTARSNVLEEEKEQLLKQIESQREMLDDLSNGLSAMGAERDTAQARNAEMAAQRDALAVERDTSQARNAEMAAQCDALVAERDTAQARNAEMAVQRDALAAERDTARARNAETVAQRDALQLEVDARRTAEHDLRAQTASLTDALETQRAVLDDLGIRFAELSKARDLLVEEIAAARVRAEELEASLAGAMQQLDTSTYEKLRKLLVRRSDSKTR